MFEEPIVLTVDYDDADDLADELSEHLTTMSMCVANRRALPVGADVLLVLSFPGLVEPLRIAGVVRQVQSGADALLAIELVWPARQELAALVARIRRRDPKLIKRVLRALVVDDNPHVADLIQHGLGHARELPRHVAFDCHIANDGRTALAQVKGGAFDVLIVDVYLPIVSGAQLIALVRNELALRDLPIIAVSAGGAAAQHDALAAGANIFIDKPMRLRSLVATMRALFDLDRVDGAA